MEPQYVCGAATVLSQHREMKPEHVAKGQLRQEQESGKKAKNLGSFTRTGK
jgi:hypothetical protein